MGWYRWRRRGPGRPMKPRVLGIRPSGTVFMPMDLTATPPANAVVISPDELEAMRLVYFLKLSQEEAAKRMGVSRGTLWRLLENGRRKMVEALVESKPIVISPILR